MAPCGLLGVLTSGESNLLRATALPTATMSYIFSGNDLVAAIFHQHQGQVLTCQDQCK